MLLILLTLLLTLLLLIVLYERIRDRSIPPGPPRLPLIGNLHQAPKGNTLAWHLYDKWSQIYGPIYSVQFGRNLFIMISSPEIASDLLEKRGSKYSDRPRMVMAGENLMKGMHIMFRQYDEGFKMHQRMEAGVLNKRSAGGYEVVQDLETKQMLFDFLHEGEGEAFARHFERFAISVVYCLCYGFRVEKFEDEDVEAIHRVQKNLGFVLQPGRWVVDAIPILNRLPKWLAPWKKVAEEFYQLESSLHLKHLRFGVGEARGWNFSKEFAMSEEGMDMDVMGLAYDLGILADAGLDTTAMVLEVFAMAAVTQPEFLAMAQAELDNVVGDSRLPTFADRASLPYCNAVVKETFRWRTITPTSFPHTTNTEDYYQGYRIPAGSSILALQYSMNLDPTRFPDPHAFRPERWLEPGAEKLKYYAWGNGRRICPGRHIAENSVWIVLTRIMWGFYIVPGGELPDVMKHFAPLFNSKPLPFKADFNVKSENHRVTIIREWEGAQTDVGIIMDKIEKTRSKVSG